MRVIGIGNMLLCDEGIGIHVVAELERRGAFPGVEFLDGGVAGSALIPLVEGQERVVLVDAADAPFPPGTVLRLSPSDAAAPDGAPLSLHDVTLSDTLALLRLRGTLPPVRIVGIVPADVTTCRVGPSDALAARFDEIVENVGREIAASSGRGPVTPAPGAPRSAPGGGAGRSSGRRKGAPGGR